jgi:hypothetical protein
MDGNFLSFLQSYLSNRFNRVIYQQYKTKWKIQEFGLPQGGPLMPILWTIYINDIKIKNNKKIKLVAFADDMSMYTLPSELSPTTTYQLQEAIDDFYDWTLQWKLIINPNKCNSISFTRKAKIKAEYIQLITQTWSVYIIHTTLQIYVNIIQNIYIQMI